MKQVVRCSTVFFRLFNTETASGLDAVAARDLGRSSRRKRISSAFVLPLLSDARYRRERAVLRCEANLGRDIS